MISDIDPQKQALSSALEKYQNLVNLDLNSQWYVAINYSFKFKKYFYELIESIKKLENHNCRDLDYASVQTPYLGLKHSLLEKGVIAVKIVGSGKEPKLFFVLNGSVVQISHDNSEINDWLTKRLERSDIKAKFQRLLSYKSLDKHLVFCMGNATPNEIALSQWIDQRESLIYPTISPELPHEINYLWVISPNFDVWWQWNRDESKWLFFKLDNDNVDKAKNIMELIISS